MSIIVLAVPIFFSITPIGPSFSEATESDTLQSPVGDGSQENPFGFYLSGKIDSPQTIYILNRTELDLTLVQNCLF